MGCKVHQIWCWFWKVLAAVCTRVAEQHQHLDTLLLGSSATLLKQEDSNIVVRLCC
jgi:hypothetical protein